MQQVSSERTSVAGAVRTFGRYGATSFKHTTKMLDGLFTETFGVLVVLGRVLEGVESRRGF
jgi:hypothetical protein